MAQTGYTPISLYYSTTGGASPSAGNLANGELAVNITDGKLFYKDNGGAVQVIGWKTVPVSAGGTGSTSLTANNVLLGNGTSALQVVAPGTAGNVLTSNGTTWTSAVLPAGGLTYVYKTSNYTTQDKEGVLTNTSGGSFTVTLPATPSVGAQVVVADAGNSWGTNNLTVGRNGSTIQGSASDLICDITGASVQFVYDGTTWDVYAQVGGNAGSVATVSGSQTLTNKRIDPRTSVATSASSLTPDISSFDQYAYTALAVGLTINAPVGTPVDGNKLLFRILDSGSSQTLTWNATFTAIGVTLPTSTTAGKTTYVGCVYNANNTRWDVVAVTTQA